MSSTPNPTTYLGRVWHRSDRRIFGIRQDDRFFHSYIIGKTGTGKSHLLEQMAVQDALSNRGFALFDPHGDLVRNVHGRIVRIRRDVVFLDVPNSGADFSFNPLANVPESHRALAAAGLVEVFKKIWPDDWGPRLEHLLRNVVFALLEVPGSSLADIAPLLSDRDYRRSLARSLTNPFVRAYWLDEFEKYSPAFRAVVVAPLQNKIGALLTDPLLFSILTGNENPIDLSRIMNRGGILLVNLEKGRIGEGPATILGSFLVSHIALAGLQRSSQTPETRRDFVVYLDEFHSFSTLSLVTMLSELRKYHVGLVLAHQHLSQLDDDLRDAVFGNVGTLMSFRVGGADASYLAREFSPTFAADDLIALDRFHVYVRLMISGVASRPFSAQTATLQELGIGRLGFESDGEK